jgi:CRP-like cAMP-binding protein
MNNILDFLSNISLFIELNTEDISKFVNLFDKRSYGSGSTVIHKGDPGNSIYFVFEGRLKATMKGEDGREKILSIFEKGHYFGEISLFGKGLRTAFIMAMTKCELLTISKENFSELIDSNSLILKNLTRDLCGRLEYTDKQLYDSIFTDADQKILNALDYLSKNSQFHGKGKKIIEGITIKDLADLAGVVRPTASKIISKYKRDGYIEVKNKNITILRNDFLRT